MVNDQGRRILKGKDLDFEMLQDEIFNDGFSVGNLFAS